MMSIAFLLVCLSASTGSCNDVAACATDAVADGGDDRCQLLQGGVGLLTHHGEDKHGQLVKGEHEADATAKGFPDILKGITDAIGGVGNLEKDFDAIKTAVGTFVQEAHTAVTSLAENARPSMSFDALQAQVQQTYKDIHTAALKLYQTLAKTTETFTHGVGKLLPETFKSAMKKVLDKISQQAMHFADSFSHAGAFLIQIPVGLSAQLKNHTLIAGEESACNTVKSNLDNVHKMVEKLSASALALSAKGMSKEILKAKDALPDQIKQEVDKILHKANEAAESLMSSMSSTVQDLSQSIAKAFEGHCVGLESGAGRLEVGLLSALMIAVLHLSM